jgi:ATP-dependent Clp protease, protease subunit
MNNQPVQPAPAASPPPKKPVIIYFCAPMVHPATTKFRTTLCNAVNLQVPSITVFMSSGGGMVEEGISLYGFIRSLPVEITIHNIGNVDSIALAVYLAASKRLANPDATFLMHDFYFPQPVQVSNRHQAADISVGLAGARRKTVGILRERTEMTDEQFQSLKFLEESTIQDAEAAKQFGIAHDIQQAVVPAGAELFNIEY